MQLNEHSCQTFSFALVPKKRRLWSVPRSEEGKHLDLKE